MSPPVLLAVTGGLAALASVPPPQGLHAVLNTIAVGTISMFATAVTKAIDAVDSIVVHDPLGFDVTGFPHRVMVKADFLEDVVDDYAAFNVEKLAYQGSNGVNGGHQTDGGCKGGNEQESSAASGAKPGGSGLNGGSHGNRNQSVSTVCACSCGRDHCKHCKHTQQQQGWQHILSSCDGHCTDEPMSTQPQQALSTVGDSMKCDLPAVVVCDGDSSLQLLPLACEAGTCMSTCSTQLNDLMQQQNIGTTSSFCSRRLDDSSSSSSSNACNAAGSRKPRRSESYAANKGSHSTRPSASTSHSSQTQPSTQRNKETVSDQVLLHSSSQSNAGSSGSSGSGMSAPASSSSSGGGSPNNAGNSSNNQAPPYKQQHHTVSGLDAPAMHLESLDGLKVLFNAVWSMLWDAEHREGKLATAVMQQRHVRKGLNAYSAHPQVGTSP